MNSALNPEAPEFYPHLNDVTQDGYTTVNKTIRSSNHIPAGPSYSMFTTYTDFNIVTCKISNNINEQSNEIVVAELAGVKLRWYDDDYNTEKIIDANDSMIDRVLINIDTETGVNRPNEKFMESIRAAGKLPSWNQQQTPVIAKIEVDTATFIGGKNIPRPQLMFKDRINNSTSLWVPKISDKPNSIKPLALNILYNDEGEAYGYEHPYEVELELYEPPAWVLEEEEGKPELPPPLDSTPLTLVATEPQLDQLVEHLLAVDELAVDLEHHSYRTYLGITCLIQITTREGGDFIIDALAVREHIHKLNIVFTDPKKLKVFHGAESDVLWLQRDFGVYLVGLFDTHLAAKALGLKGLSLKFLLQKYCEVIADKKFQLADWRIRPLPAELVTYARTDTHYLLYVWRRMRADLRAPGADLLRPVLLQGRHVCAQTYSKRVVDDYSHMPLYQRSRKAFTVQQLAALQLLFKWRDSHARELDESTGYLVPNHMLVALAEALPRDVQGVAACCSPMPPFVKQHLITINRIILSCRELPSEGAFLATPPELDDQVEEASAALAAKQLAMFDLKYMALLSEEPQDECVWSAEAVAQRPAPPPLLPALAPPPPPPAPAPAAPDTPLHIVSELNVHAELFVPPYERYTLYRDIVEVDEIRELKEKEARIAALSKGNELIKTEVLLKLQQARDTHAQNEERALAQAGRGVQVEGARAAAVKEGARETGVKVEGARETGVKVEGASETCVKVEGGKETEVKVEGAKETGVKVEGPKETGVKVEGAKETGEKVEGLNMEQRKRKISNDKSQKKEREASLFTNPCPVCPQKYDNKRNTKSHVYKNYNFKSFYDDSEKGHKQPKMKFKKHK